MFLEERFCPRCGASLECPSCGGSGKQADPPGDQLGRLADAGKYCCGQLHFGNYCPSCGKFLKPLFETPKKERRCTSCNGTGKISHFCGF